MKRSISFQMGVMERQQSLRLRVMDKQRSFTVEVIEDEPILEKKIKNNSGKRGDSALHLAVRLGSLTQVKDILMDFKTSGLNELIWKKNNDGETAFFVAAEKGHVEVFREILKVADMQSAALKANNSLDSFHIAAKLGHADVLKELLHSFPDFALTTNPSNATALYTAAAQGHINVVNILLETDASLARIARNNGKTALHIAARMGHLEVVKALLIKDPAIVGRTDKKGQTALHMAVKGQNAKVVEELLNNFPSVASLVDNKGNTALHTAIRKGRPQIIQSLLSFPGININAFNKAGETALAITEKCFNEDLANILSEAGAVSVSLKRDEDTDCHPPPTTPNQLKKTVSFIKQEVKFQLRRSCRTQMRVLDLKKKVEKVQISGLNNVINSNIVVATLIASVAFAAIFQVPGQYTSAEGEGYSLGQAYIANGPMFFIFLVSDSLALFISLAVVVVQTSLIVIDQKAMRLMVFVINKLMWLCCISISVSFISLSYVVIGRQDCWLAWSTVVVSTVIMLSTLGIMCYCIVLHRVGRKKLKNSIRRNSGIESSLARCPSQFEAECKTMYAL